MKLISMTDFVLEQQGKILNSELGWLAICYANFLKQPLKLENFVPCDEDGNIMNTLSIYDPRSKTGKYYPEEIKRAEEKVLFESKGLFIRNCGKYGYSIETKNYNYIFNSSKSNTHKNIEDLIGLNLELTPNALKQIGI